MRRAGPSAWPTKRRAAAASRRDERALVVAQYPYRALSNGTLIKADLASSDEDDYSSSNSAQRPRARGCKDSSEEYDY